MRGFDCEVWISDTDNEGLAMMSMISLFYQDVEHDVYYKYRDVEHGSRQGLDGVGGGEGGDCGRSPARRGPVIRRLKKIQIYCYRKRTP